MRVFATGCLAALMVTAPLNAAEARTATEQTVPAGKQLQVPLNDTREPSRDRFGTERLGELTTSRKARVAETAPAVGAVRRWPALDDTQGDFYRKEFTLRAIGEHIEVWVANDLSFRAGDCRAWQTPGVTDAQLAAMVNEFDNTIYPRETKAFSTPPDRDGSRATLGGDFTGDGAKTVTLVDNVRDANYLDFPEAKTYISGFFSSQVNDLVDRNVMTIDGYDWEHRTGANPPNEPTDDLCTSRPARPRMYEATFAHEWQHLLQHYVDPDEESWVNEGLSEYAQTLAGYVDSDATVRHRGADAHLYCFQGFGPVVTPGNPNPLECGGAQNSLNLWDEGEPDQVLADYGNAYQFMLYLHDRFGAEVLQRLHRDGELQGLAGVRAALKGHKFYDVLHDFQTMTLVDKPAEGATLHNLEAKAVTAKSLRSTVNLSNPESYARPGAAPNGADYVRLRDAKGHGLTGAQLTSVAFVGSRTLPPKDLEWTERDGAFFSGAGNNRDAAAVTEVDVPQDDPALTFRTRYGAEQGYDYGYVIVSADGGKTYRVVAGDRTTEGPRGPGLTGTTDGFEKRRYDLGEFRGKRVLLGFRYVSDGGVDQGGWYVDDPAVGGNSLVTGSFREPTQIVPTAVHGWNARLIGIDEARHRVVAVPVNKVAALRSYRKIVAIVSYDEPTGQIKQYAPYTLTVNGVEQPGS